MNEYQERAERAERELDDFRKFVSQECRAALDGYNDAYCPATHLEKHLTQFIIEPEDALLASVQEACRIAYGSCPEEFARAATEALRDGLSRRGLMIK